MTAIRGSASLPSPRRRARISSAVTRRSPSSHAACSASSSRCCSGSPVSARPRSCGPGSCRACAASFIAELADLVENRAPKALEAKFDEDESAAGRFDFARSDYRVMIALREDYLAQLEGLKKDIPSITQNRLRLAPMTGTQ